MVIMCAGRRKMERWFILRVAAEESGNLNTNLEIWKFENDNRK
jgi:hypothetical protein